MRLEITVSLQVGKHVRMPTEKEVIRLSTIVRLQIKPTMLGWPHLDEVGVARHTLSHILHVEITLTVTYTMWVYHIPSL